MPLRVLHFAVLAVLLAGCGAPPQRDDPNLIENIAHKTPEQIRKENEADIKAAAEAAAYQEYVCSQPEPQRRELIEKTAAENGWQIACSN